jgi:excisionase family DNA binding protein
VRAHNFISMASDERTLSIQQATAVAGVSRRTIYNWLHAGKLTYKRTVGGSIRIFESSLWQKSANSLDEMVPVHRVESGGSV